MGYDERLLKSTCKGCKTSHLFRRQPGQRLPRQWTCGKCKGENIPATPPEWPEVPGSIFIVADHSRLLKLYPVPPEQSDEPWARPYGVRSVLYQASRAFGGCRYTCSARGVVYDESVFFDRCTDPANASDGPEAWECHILSGWSAGSSSCALFESVASLCQTDIERKFLSTY